MPGQSDADFAAATLGWQRQLAMLNWNGILETSLRGALPQNIEIDKRALLSIPEAGERHTLRKIFARDPTLLGRTVPVSLLASANVDNWLKGAIDRSLPDSQQQLSGPARRLSDLLVENGTMTKQFAWSLFFNVDSRLAPASAGLAGAFWGRSI